MVKVDPAARITAKEIRDHHWVKVCDYPVRLTFLQPNFTILESLMPLDTDSRATELD